jgi:hypothetical protein
MDVNMKKEPIEERLKKHVEHVGDCWLWTACKNNSGYGMVRRDRKMVTAHRASYEAFVGPVPEGKDVCHTCNHNTCINPNHLLAMTHKENYTKRVAEGRNVNKNYTK